MVSAWRLGTDFPHHNGGHVYIYYLTTSARVEDLVLGEGQAMHYASIADVNPSQPYRGYPFTPLTARALRTYLETRVGSQEAL
jgi:hypothetical protein